MRNNQPVTSREYVLDDDHFLISHTDTGGRITYANPAFIEVSGFSNEELVGAPHNIVRHPDMPEAAFADLWRTLKAGEHWVGLVKNRRKNGDFYWVRAQVTPIVEAGRTLGYVSVRTRATPAAIARTAQAYALMASEKGGGVGIERGRLYRRGPGRALVPRFADVASAGLTAFFLLSALLVCCATGLGLYGLSVAGGDVGSLRGLLWAVPLLGLPALTALWLLNRRHLVRPLRDAVHFSVQIAAGNLAARLPEHRHGKTGELMATLDIMRRSLGSIARDVRDGIAVVSPAARDIAAGNEEMNDRAQRQASSLQQTASTMEQITAAVQQNTEHSRQARGLASESAQTVEANGELMGQVVESMARITQGSERMADIIEVIDGIAFQTNILALNASVEAARAGEQGRGFAVVASEVRTLAGRSADAAKEIRELISSSSNEIESGGDQVRQAGESMDALVRKVKQLSQLMTEINSASEEQNSGIAQVTAAIADMDTVMRQDADRVRATASGTARMRARVEELAHSAAVFRFGQQSESETPKSRRGSAARNPAVSVEQARPAASPPALTGS